MRKPIFIILCIVTVLFEYSHISAQITTDKRCTNMYMDWKFIKQDVSNAQSPSLSDASWRDLNLPHDWSIEGKFSANEPTGSSFGYLPSGIGWYRKSFTLSGDLTSKKVFIHFEGVYHQSKVYINGKLLGERFYGYSQLIYDLTPHLTVNGKNVLAVRVDNTDPDSRWYTGSGIYRDVWLVVTDNLHVDHFGTTITTPTSAPLADVRVATSVKNEYRSAMPVTLETILQDSSGNVLGRDSSVKEIGANELFVFTQDFINVPISLWSTKSPTMYQAVSRVISAGTVKDSLVSPFGVRKVEFNKERGFLLNDKPILLKGVNMHHDLGCIGSAYYERAMIRRLNIFKSMGINAIRTSHNPHASNLLDLCDRMGFLVVDEAFDKFSGDFFPTYNQDWKKDLQDFIDRDKNHPCVVQWSVGNEVAEDDGARLKAMVDFVHSYEPTRPVSFSWSPHTVNSFLDGNSNLKSQLSSMDVLNINYAEHLVERVRALVHNKVMLMTEAMAYYRGQGTTIKAYFEQNPWLDVPEYDYLSGAFLWTGIDYIGEAVSGWPMHGWNCSLVDLTGYMRPVAYLHKSFVAEQPMVYIAVRHKELDVPPAVKGHWDWPPLVNHWTLTDLEGETVRVYAYTNQPTVELTVNGVSKGKKNLADFTDKMIYWDLPYEPGTIRADCGSADQSVVSYQLKTAGEAAKIELTADTTTIFSNGKDVCHIEVRIMDAEGNLVPSAKNTLTFKVIGEGTLLAIDNGDLQSTEQYQGTDRRSAFYGRALAVLKSGMSPGTMQLTASAPGLASSSIVIKTINETGGTHVNSVYLPQQKKYRSLQLSKSGEGIRVTVPDNVYYEVSVLKANGTSVAKLTVNKSATCRWNTATLANGVYIIRAQNGRNFLTKKVVVYK